MIYVMLLMVMTTILQSFMITKIIFCCQGTRHLRFHNFIVEYRRDFSPDIFYLFETCISGTQADDISKLGFDNSCKVEAVGFFGGIWILWKDSVSVDIVALHH